MSHADFVLIFKALADETRLNIVTMLKNGEHCACEILEHFDITQPTLSYHMKLLCECGLVEGRRDGAWMRYTLNKESLTSLQKMINTLNECENVSSECECLEKCNKEMTKLGDIDVVE